MQMIDIRIAEASVKETATYEDDIFSEKFPIKALLQALEEDETGEPPVLLIDELDRTDEPFEAFLFEVLSDFQVTIPEIGTVKAKKPLIVIITSNRTWKFRRHQTPLFLLLGRLPRCKRGTRNFMEGTGCTRKTDPASGRIRSAPP